MKKNKSMVFVCFTVLLLTIFFNVTGVQAESNNGIFGRIASLEAKITSLLEKVGLIETDVSELQTTLANQQNEIATLKNVVISQREELLQLKEAVINLQNDGNDEDNNGGSNSPVETKGVIEDKYYRDGDFYITLKTSDDVVYNYKLDKSIDYGTINEGDTVEVTLNEGIVVAISILQFQVVTGTIEDIDRTVRSIKILDTWYSVSEEIDLNDFSIGDSVQLNLTNDIVTGVSVLDS